MHLMVSFSDAAYAAAKLFDVMGEEHRHQCLS
jgi:hypothetical protein